VANAQKSEPQTVAAVDLGSNSFHLLLARLDDGQPVVIDRLREMVQLAGGLDESGRLSEDARSGALECLRRFGERLRHVPPSAVRAVGTNTFRSAHGITGFVRAAEEALGHPIETVSGTEEARLVYLGVAHSLPGAGGRRLVIDIGGGSTELIVGQGFQPLVVQSLYMGAVSLSRRFFSDGKIKRERWKQATLAARQELEPLRASFRQLGWEQAIGSSGTIRAARKVIRTLGDDSDEIRPDTLDLLSEAILEAGNVKRLKLEGLNPKRRAVFPGGVIVLAAAVRELGIEQLQVSEGALREGLLYDLLGRFRAEDVRERSVEALATRHHVDKEHAERVRRTALALLDQAAADWGLDDPAARLLLSWAARLHEVGLDIAHGHYHKHGEYIVANTDLPGFSVDGQRVLATLVRAHRRKFPLGSIKLVHPDGVRSTGRLAVLLRLAVVLHRSRSPEPLPAPRLSVSKRSIELEFPADWLEHNPLTRADLELETGYLAEAGFKLRCV
jgi:exopolyphosphatase/guanosine-5'-triphosphate,3'-diphosphate pyrophosphatase